MYLEFFKRELCKVSWEISQFSICYLYHAGLSFWFWLTHKIFNFKRTLDLQHKHRALELSSNFPHCPCLHFPQRMGTCFFWIFPHSHLDKCLVPLAKGERCAHTCGQTNMRNSAAPTVHFPFSSPICPHLGPKAGGAPGAEQGTSWSAVDGWALISPSQTRAALLCQAGQGRSSLGDSMQIPWSGQQRGKCLGEGPSLVTKEDKMSLWWRELSLPYRWHLCCLWGEVPCFNISFYVVFNIFFLRTSSIILQLSF